MLLGLAPQWLIARSEAATRRAIEDIQLARCLAIEARNGARPRQREEFQAVCLDPRARIRQFYGLEGPGSEPAHVEHAGEPSEEPSEEEQVSP